MPARNFELVPDPQARNRALATTHIKPGYVILRTPSYSTALLPKWKGERCDWCCRRTTVKACTKCREVWYCDEECQMLAWKDSHRKICSLLSKGFHLSASYLEQDPDQKTNSDLLLSLYGKLLVASRLSFFQGDEQTAKQESENLSRLDNDPTLCFKSLIAHPHPRSLPAVPAQLRGEHGEFFRAAWARFDCNNFVLHNISSLEPEAGSYAQGIFPFASRCFNHSCVPSAWCAFMLQDRHAWLEVRALVDIQQGQEITIPYLDPALSYQERQNRLKQAYFFSCECTKCRIEKALPSPASISSHDDMLEEMVGNLTFEPNTADLRVIASGVATLRGLPSPLTSIRQDSFLKNLTERFETIAHDGPYDTLWQVGKALLAVCLISYPHNYPLTAYYAIELAKGCWNAHLLESQYSNGKFWLLRVQSAIDFAKPMLQIIGGEEECETAQGLVTIETLESLLEEEK
ncbi:hypothetical protein CPB86DRAFT_530653 [Serendipita vermifera]|nr:hypothetical protein CPB86DRAFT_530653 [Serendipita vermifera]